MPTFDLNKQSFNAGIWSELLDSRSDLDRYPAACSELKNFIPHPYGGISNRAGTEFLYDLGENGARLIPFQFNAEQSYVLAFYAGGGIVLKDGETIQTDSDQDYNFIHPYQQDDLGGIQYLQSADVIYLLHSKHPPAKIIRLDHNNWEYSPLLFSNNTPTPNTGSITTLIEGTDLTYYEYAITLVDNNGNEGGLYEIPGQATIGDRLNFGKLPSSYDDCFKYNIYRKEFGAWGWVDDATGSSWIDPEYDEDHPGEVGTDPDMSASPPYPTNPFDSEGNYPNCACIHQGRLIFAGTNNKPKTFWGSRSGAFTDLSKHSPLQDDDAYEFEVSSINGRVDKIVWIRSFGGDLLIGTSDGEYLVTGKITGKEVQIDPQTGYGSAPIPSVVAGDDILFVQKGKNIIRSTLYDALSEKYKGSNITTMAEEFFENHKLVAMAWQRDPQYVLWCIRNDGSLLGLTYIKDEKIWAWHIHNTQGSFIDIAVISDSSGEDRTYFIVKRDGKYFIEQFKSRNLAKDINNSWFLDSAIEYSGAEATILSRLNHLEGKKVSVFSQGSVIEELTVTGGAITLPFPVTEAVVGLTYSSIASTMEVALPAGNKYSMSVINSIVGATIYFKDTCRIRLSINSPEDITKWKDIGVSLQHDLSAPYTLTSGKFYYTLSNDNKLADGEVACNRLSLRNDMPLPCTIAGMAARVTVGDIQ